MDKATYKASTKALAMESKKFMKQIKAEEQQKQDARRNTAGRGGR